MKRLINLSVFLSLILLSDSTDESKGVGEMKKGEIAMGKDNCQTETSLAAQTTMSDIRMMHKSHTVK